MSLEILLLSMCLLPLFRLLLLSLLLLLLLLTKVLLMLLLRPSLLLRRDVEEDATEPLVVRMATWLASMLSRTTAVSTSTAGPSRE